MGFLEKHIRSGQNIQLELLVLVLTPGEFLLTMEHAGGAGHR